MAALHSLGGYYFDIEVIDANRPLILAPDVTFSTVNAFVQPKEGPGAER